MSARDLTDAQLDGLACAVCGADLTAPGTKSAPAGHGPRGQLFTCTGHGEPMPELTGVQTCTGTVTVAPSVLGSELLSITLDDGVGAGRVVILDVESAHSLIDALQAQIRAALGID